MYVWGVCVIGICVYNEHTHTYRVKGVPSPFKCGTITYVVSMTTCGGWEEKGEGEREGK